MPKGELFINGKDAYVTWGISMDTSSLSALMTPAPNKDYIRNESRLEDGSRLIYDNPRKGERDLTLSLNLTAKNEDDFFSRYISFCEELEGGVLEISTRYQPDIVYKTVYKNCSQFTQFMRGMAKFSLKLLEPNPTNRNTL